MKRLVIALLLIPLLYLYVTKLGPQYFTALLAVACLLAQYEFYAMYNLRGVLRYAGLAAGAALVIVSYFSAELLPQVLMLSFLLIAGIRLIAKKDPLTSLRDISPALIGILYIPLLLTPQVRLREMSSHWIIFLYASIWASDSLAYYIGTGIGKRKLYPEVSPNKTVEGAAASIIGGTLGAMLISILLKIPVSIAISALAGATIGLVTITGDLVESMFKRDAGVKDSGGLIPGGHGGILDKIDAVLFAGPVLYWMLRWLGIL